MERHDVVVVGSGVIGLAAAWRAARHGRSVLVCDPHPGRGASYAAAGMLAPVTEAAYGEEELVELCRRSADLWPQLAAEIERESGLGVGLESCGTLLVAADASDRAYLERLAEFHARLGLDSKWCRPSACREIEPLLAPGIAGGLFAPGDRQIDNRRLIGALAEAALRAGVEFRREAVVGFVEQAGRLHSLRLASGEEVEGGIALLAGGAASGQLAPGLLPAPRPVKGQILRLRTPALGPALSRTVRAVVSGTSVYVVPRAGGEVVVGATVEEHPEAEQVSAGGVYDLLRDAITVLPALYEYELVEAMAAARPGSPDNAPLVGRSALEGLVVATGHYRHGILLTPITLAVLEPLLDGGEAPDWAAPLSPARFAALGAVGGS